MEAQKGCVNLLNNCCSAGDALLSNSDPPGVMAYVNIKYCRMSSAS